MSTRRHRSRSNGKLRIPWIGIEEPLYSDFEWRGHSSESGELAAYEYSCCNLEQQHLQRPVHGVQRVSVEPVAFARHPVEHVLGVGESILARRLNKRKTPVSYRPAFAVRIQTLFFQIGLSVREQAHGNLSVRTIKTDVQGPDLVIAGPHAPMVQEASERWLE